MSVSCVRPVRRLDVINVWRLRVTAAGYIKKNTTQHKGMLYVECHLIYQEANIS